MVQGGLWVWLGLDATRPRPQNCPYWRVLVPLPQAATDGQRSSFWGQVSTPDELALSPASWVGCEAGMDVSRPEAIVPPLSSE